MGGDEAGGARHEPGGALEFLFHLVDSHLLQAPVLETRTQLLRVEGALHVDHSSAVADHPAQPVHRDRQELAVEDSEDQGVQVAQLLQIPHRHLQLVERLLPIDHGVVHQRLDSEPPQFLDDVGDPAVAKVGDVLLERQAQDPDPALGREPAPEREHLRDRHDPHNLREFRACLITDPSALDHAAGKGPARSCPYFEFSNQCPERSTLPLDSWR